MTCRSCIHSAERHDGMLWCCQWGRVARQTCADFIYEPGTDAAEREQRHGSDTREVGR